MTNNRRNQTNRSSPVTTVALEHAEHVYTFGTILAVTMSWSANHSVAWASVHGLMSYLYIVLYVFGVVDQAPAQ
jgi:hypothetical protein